MKIIIFTMILLAIYRLTYATDDSWIVFDDTQVAIINIYMDSTALNWMWQEENLESDSLHLAAVSFKNKWIDEEIDSVGIRLRGNTSRFSAKKSFKLSFNTFVQGREFYDLDKMNINGEHNDPSVIRSKLSWDLFHKIGLTASRSFYAAVYINDIYYGLYIVVEHIDDEFLNKRYADDNGNLWKCLWPADLVYISSDPDAYKYFNDVAQRYPYDLKTNEEENDFSQLARFIDIIDNTNPDNMQDSLEQIINIEEILKYMAINVLTGSWDDYWFNKNNFYIYYEPSEDRFHIIPYDYDNTFGISWFSTDWTDVDPYYFAEYEGQQGSRPLIDAILAIPAYRNLYTHFLQYYTDYVFNLNTMNNRIDSLKALIENPWIKDDSLYTKSYGFTADDFDKSYSVDGYYFEPHVRRGLKEYINLRVASIESQLAYISGPPALYHPQWTSSKPYPNDTIFVSISIFDPDNINTAGVILVNNEEQTPFIMSADSIDNSAIMEIVDRWSGFISPVGEEFNGGFYFATLDEDGQYSRYPASSLIPLSTGNSQGSGIKINEFLADNIASNMDQDSEYDDWLELYNTDATPQLISGKYLTDNPQNLNKWLIPGEDVSLMPGEHLLIWCDEDDQTGYHANFKISKSGEFIALVASDGITILDSLSFGTQRSDTSYGRLPDGSDSWIYMTPTPGASNRVTALTEPLANLPETFNLKLYPNPFNSVVVVEFTLSTASKVYLQIYNTLGETIQATETGMLNKGTNKIHIDMKKESSGMYFIRLDTGKYQAVRKILLIR